MEKRSQTNRDLLLWFTPPRDATRKRTAEMSPVDWSSNPMAYLAAREVATFRSKSNSTASIVFLATFRSTLR